jgi:hypothetical protein
MDTHRILFWVIIRVTSELSHYLFWRLTLTEHCGSCPSALPLELSHQPEHIHRSLSIGVQRAWHVRIADLWIWTWQRHSVPNLLRRTSGRSPNCMYIRIRRHLRLNSETFTADGDAMWSLQIHFCADIIWAHVDNGTRSATLNVIARYGTSAKCRRCRIIPQRSFLNPVTHTGVRWCDVITGRSGIELRTECEFMSQSIALFNQLLEWFRLFWQQRMNKLRSYSCAWNRDSASNNDFPSIRHQRNYLLK